MNKTRLEAFSDAVIAIIMTIMVLELHAPDHPAWTELRPLLPKFLVYLLSFVFLGIYWNNHHHLLHAAGRIRGGVLWANLHLLFWLSLVPFVTAWMGENHFAAAPTALYGIVMLLSAIAYYVLQTILIRQLGPDSTLARAVGRDLKGKVSPVLYLVAIPMSFYLPVLSVAIYVGVALIWLAPDPRIEREIA